MFSLSVTVTVGNVYRVSLWQKGDKLPLLSEEKGSRENLLNLME